jgi:hypothetical protein
LWDILEVYDIIVYLVFRGVIKMARINIIIVVGAILAIISAVLLVKNVLITYKLSDNGAKNFIWVSLVLVCFVCGIVSVTQGLGAQSVYEDAMNSVGYFRDMYNRHIGTGTKAAIGACVIFVIESFYYKRMKNYMDLKVKNRKDAWNLEEITRNMK